MSHFGWLVCEKDIFSCLFFFTLQTDTQNSVSLSCSLLTYLSVRSHYLTCPFAHFGYFSVHTHYLAFFCSFLLSFLPTLIISPFCYPLLALTLRSFFYHLISHSFSPIHCPSPISLICFCVLSRAHPSIQGLWLRIQKPIVSVADVQHIWPCQ